MVRSGRSPALLRKVTIHSGDPLEVVFDTETSPTTETASRAVRTFANGVRGRGNGSSDEGMGNLVRGGQGSQGTAQAGSAKYFKTRHALGTQICLHHAEMEQFGDPHTIGRVPKLVPGNRQGRTSSEVALCATSGARSPKRESVKVPPDASPLW